MDSHFQPYWLAIDGSAWASLRMAALKTMCVPPLPDEVYAGKVSITGRIGAPLGLSISWLLLSIQLGPKRQPLDYSGV